MPESITDTVDTIAAIATPPGRGGVGIVRVSGPRVPTITKTVLGCLPVVRQAYFGNFLARDNTIIDQGVALFFSGPKSFTGEDVLELQGHGGPVVMDQLLQVVLAAGARLAKPGEFSERAFLNGKMDLAQAEAVADLIDASSERAASSAMRSLQGDFSRKITEFNQQIITLRTHVEATIDFADEDIDFIEQYSVKSQLVELQSDIREIMQTAKQGAMLREGLQVVIAGRPNAGKSSLLNALSGRESAIVTDQAGTTRDVLREEIQIDGLPLHIIDTAGLHDSDDIVEQEGIRRAKLAIKEADILLVVVDSTDANRHNSAESDFVRSLLADQALPIVVIRNKSDLSGENFAVQEDTQEDNKESVERSNRVKYLLSVSAKTGAGLDSLRELIKTLAGYRSSVEGVFIARRRHIAALQRADSLLQTSITQLNNNSLPELVAEDLRQAQLALSEITGEFTTEDLLGSIFSTFCVGK